MSSRGGEKQQSGADGGGGGGGEEGHASWESSMLNAAASQESQEIAALQQYMQKITQNGIDVLFSTQSQQGPREQQRRRGKRPLILAAISAWRFELTSNFAKMVGLPQYDEETSNLTFQNRRYGFDLVLFDGNVKTKCVLMPTSDNNRMFNKGMVDPCCLLAVSDYRLWSDPNRCSTEEKIPLLESVAVVDSLMRAGVSTMKVIDLAQRSPWSEGTPRYFQDYDVPLVNCSREFYLPACNEDGMHAHLLHLSKLPPRSPGGGTARGAWEEEPGLPQIGCFLTDQGELIRDFAADTSSSSSSSSSSSHSHSRSHSFASADSSAAPRSIVDPITALHAQDLVALCNTRVDGKRIGARWRKKRQRDGGGHRLELKDAVIGRIVRKTKIFHYGKFVMPRQCKCPYLFEFEITDASMHVSDAEASAGPSRYVEEQLAGEEGWEERDKGDEERTITVTAWDHMVPLIYHRLPVGCVIAIWGHRWYSKGGKPRIKLNIGDCIVALLNFEGGTKAAAANVMLQLHQRLRRPPMNFVPSNALPWVPHGSPFDFVGLLMHVGPKIRVRKRATNSIERMLDDVSADAAFSEFRMIVLRDGSGNADSGDGDGAGDGTQGGDLCVKMFTNSRIESFQSIHMWVGHVVALTDLVLIDDTMDVHLQAAKSDCSLFAITSNSSDVYAIPTGRDVLEASRKDDPLSFWSPRNGRILLDQEPIVREAVASAYYPPFKCGGDPHLMERFHCYETSLTFGVWLSTLPNENAVWSRNLLRRRPGATDLVGASRWKSTPVAALKDMSKLCESLHFREHMLVRSKGVVESIEFCPSELERDSSLSMSILRWQHLTLLETRDSKQDEVSQNIDDILTSLHIWSNSWWKVVMADAESPNAKQSFCIARVNFFEDLPLDLPESLQVCVSKLRSQLSVSGTPIPFESLVVCFASGLSDDDEVSSLSLAFLVAVVVFSLLFVAIGFFFFCFLLPLEDAGTSGIP